MLKPAVPLSNDQLEEVLSRGMFYSRVQKPFRLVNRQLNPYSSRSATEIATFVGPKRQTRHVLVKYGASDDFEMDHRGGTRLETLVYERILGPVSAGPEYIGSGIDPITRRTWLIIEYITDALSLGKAPQPQSLVAAARWLGEFHSVYEKKHNDLELDFLMRYKDGYYASCVFRAIEFAGETLRDYPWFQDVCAKSRDAFGVLIDAPQTVVHGEYYAQNVLYRNGTIFPIDWESAAIAPGEIDVASLIEGWPAGVVAEVLEAYRTTRGIAPSDKEFERRLAAAQVYWSFRWLSYRPDWTIDPGARSYFDMLAGSMRRLENLSDA